MGKIPRKITTCVTYPAAKSQKVPGTLDARLHRRWCRRLMRQHYAPESRENSVRVCVTHVSGTNCLPMCPVWTILKWLPTFDVRRNANIKRFQLLVPIYRRRVKGFLLSFGRPFPPGPPKPPPLPPKNIVAEALRFRHYLTENPSRTYEETGRHFGVSRARVSQLMGILRQLPKNFLDSMSDCSDPNVLSTFSGRELIRISRLATIEKRKRAISRLEAVS